LTPPCYRLEPPATAAPFYWAVDPSRLFSAIFLTHFSDPFFGRISRVHLTILAGNYVTKLFSMMLDRSQSSRDAKGSVREA
jgi:hypothetical protein